MSNSTEPNNIQPNNTEASEATTPAADAPRRVRYESKRRELQVAEKIYLSPALLRIVLKGDMGGFDSQGFDDHIKLIFPDPVTGVVTFPGEASKDGENSGAKPIMRDYTPRYFDVAAGLLTLEFALHGLDHGEAGPATLWAANSAIGDTLHVAGPRGSRLLPETFDHYVLIGDDTAIPAIGRRLEELPSTKKVTVFIEVDGPESRFNLDTNAQAQIHWVYRTEQTLLAAVSSLELSAQGTHLWVASERTQTRAIRDLLQERFNLPSSAIKASAYWHQGLAGKHDDID